MQWKLLILFAIMAFVPMAIILLVVQNIIISQLNDRQQEKITIAKNAVTSVMVQSRRMAANYLTLISRDDAIKDSFYYAVKAREMENLKSEIQALSLSMDYDVIIARNSADESIIELGKIGNTQGQPLETLHCELHPMAPGSVCDEIWKWGDMLFLGGVAPVFKSRLVVEPSQKFSNRDYLGTLIIARALNDAFATKVRETTGVEVVIQNGETIYATSLPGLRKARFKLSLDDQVQTSGFTTQNVMGRSYLAASLPLITLSGASLGEIIILADNDAIVTTTLRIYFTIYIVSLVILMLGIAMAFAFARRIGLSIHILSEGARKIGEGDFVTNIEIKSHVELDILARSLNSMSHNLNTLLTEKESYLKEIRLQNEKIREQKEYLASLFENAQDLIYVTDIDDQITFVNKKIEDYGYSKKDLLGKSMRDFILFADKETKPGINNGKKPSVLEVGLIPREGKVRWMILSSSQVKELGGASTSELCILRDITDTKILQDKFTHFDRLAGTGRLAAGLAHEIGNPLTSISSFLQLLGKKESDPFKDDCIKTIQKHITRICFTVDRLKNLSKPHSLEKMKLSNVNSIVQSALDILQFDHRLKGIKIIQECENNLPLITVQSDQIMQALINLIMNSADAMKNSGVIRLKVGADWENSQITMEIIDTGRGIETDRLGAIFEPFFTTKGQESGTGLGLYVSQLIAQHNGGKIYVKETSENGTNICMVLPLSKQPAALATHK